jgi:hypothetical protein
MSAADLIIALCVTGSGIGLDIMAEKQSLMGHIFIVETQEPLTSTFRSVQLS